MKTFLITGSNRGIGLEFVKQLKGRGDNVIATCRSASEELNNLGVQVIENIDINSSKSIEILKERLNEKSLDCLIHNAGIAEFNSFENLNSNSIKKQFEINALSPLVMTKSLINIFNENSKIAFISSRMGSIYDNNSGSSYGYRMSKVALSMAAKSLSIDLLERNIFVAILHPGLVKTRMTNFTKNGITPQKSVKGLLKRIDLLNRSNTGTFWHANGEVLPW